MAQPDIETKRLLLRRFTLADAGDVQQLAGNIHVAKMTLNVPHPYLDGMAEDWINSHAVAAASGRQFSYAMVSRKSDALLGAISLTHIESSQANMGYWVGEPYWNTGYCSEAAGALVQYAFDELSLSRVYALHLSSNPASGKVMQKIGMRHYDTDQRLDRDNNAASVEFYEIVSN